MKNKRKIVYHNEDDVNIDLLTNPNLVVVKYIKNHENRDGRQSYIKTCTPGNYYLALKENNKYKMITRNNYDKESESYIYLNIDYRFDEHKIGTFVILPDLDTYEFLPVVSNDRDTCVNIFNGCKCIIPKRTERYSITILKEWKKYPGCMYISDNDRVAFNKLSNKCKIYSYDIETEFNNGNYNGAVGYIASTICVNDDNSNYIGYNSSLAHIYENIDKHLQKLQNFRYNKKEGKFKYVSNTIFKLDDEILEEVLNIKQKTKNFKSNTWQNKLDKEILLTIIK